MQHFNLDIARREWSAEGRFYRCIVICSDSSSKGIIVNRPIVLPTFDSVFPVLRFGNFCNAELDLVKHLLVSQRYNIAGFEVYCFIACLELYLQGANLVIISVKPRQSESLRLTCYPLQFDFLDNNSSPFSLVTGVIHNDSGCFPVIQRVNKLDTVLIRTFLKTGL